MATVSTSTGTYLSDLFDPQVVGGMINDKLWDNIVFSPLARIDYTLQGNPGDTVTLPFFKKIGDAEAVQEGHDIPIKKLTQDTKTVKVSKIGLGVQLTDESVLSGYGDPLSEAVAQIVAAIGSKVDDMLQEALSGNTDNVYTPSSAGGFIPDEIPKALALYGEQMAGQKVLIVDPDFYADLLLVKNWIPASELSANMTIQGSAGMAYGCNVIVSERVKNKNMHIVKPGALAIFTKRDVLVERDRDIVNQSDVIVGSKIFAPYLYRSGDAIVIKRES